MVLKFAANLNFLFTEFSTIAERIYRAHNAGFQAVEIPYPKAEVAEVVKAKSATGMHVALINIAVDADKNKFGCASIPGAEKEFKENLMETINLAKELNSPKIHLMSGLIHENDSVDTHYQTYETNMKYAAEQLEQNQLMGVIEPISIAAVPSYFLNNYIGAAAVLESVDNNHLKLLIDIFHLQQICGNVTKCLEAYTKILGHIQIAQVPHRHEPDVAGELDFNYIFPLIEKCGYSDWIGCEYIPKTTTEEGLKWREKFNVLSFAKILPKLASQI